MEQFERTAMLLGDGAIKKLAAAGVVIFGIGGVGGQLADSLARAGVGRFLLVDPDRVSLSNINRQIVALHSTVGRLKVDVMKERILDINPAARVEVLPLFITRDNIRNVGFEGYDVVADAIDTLDSKIEIIKKAREEAKAVVSCMGAGNRLEANFLASDISATYGCPLAKLVRARLKDFGITNVRAIFSPKSAEQNQKSQDLNQKTDYQSQKIQDLNQITNGQNQNSGKKINGQSQKTDGQSQEICEKPSSLSQSNLRKDDGFVKTAYNLSQISQNDMHSLIPNHSQSAKKPIGSVPFIPPAAGLKMAAEAIKAIICLNSD